MAQTCLFYFWFWEFKSFPSKIILNWLLTVFCALKAPLQFHFLVRSLLSPFQKSRYSEMIPQFPFLYSKLQALQLAGKGWLHLVKDEDGVQKSKNCNFSCLFIFFSQYIYFFEFTTLAFLQIFCIFLSMFLATNLWCFSIELLASHKSLICGIVKKKSCKNRCTWRQK